jgi:HlyD family secretion protein
MMMKRISILLLLLLSACGKSDDSAWLGYGEGDNAFIAAPQPGWVSSLRVERGSYVHRGDLLFTLDDTAQIATRDQAIASLETAKASLAQEEANLAYAQRQLRRQTGLARANAGTPTNLDLAKSNYEQSAARIAQLKSQIEQTTASLSGATYSLTQRNIVAQTEGRVQDIYFRPGEYVPASTPVVSILPPKNIYVRFFVPETQFSKVHIGQKVRVTCDGCQPMTAEISFIAQQEEFTPPVIFSQDSRTKLVFKLEARVPGGMKLNPGQPVQVRPL